MAPPTREKKTAAPTPARSGPTSAVCSPVQDVPGNQALTQQASGPVSTAGTAASSLAWVDEALSSPDPIAQSAALLQLMNAEGEPAWRALLLAQTSRYPEVQAEVEGIIRFRLGTEPAFEVFVRDLADNPRGALSDLAIRALVAVEGGATVNLQNYATVIVQRLGVARAYLNDLDHQLTVMTILMGKGSLQTPALDTSAIDELESQAYTLPLVDLWEVGLRASTLILQLTQAQGAADRLREASGNVAEDGAIKQLINSQLLEILQNAVQLAGTEDDPAFARIGDAVAKWPGRLAATIVDELYNQFNHLRKEVADRIPAEPRGWGSTWKLLGDKVLKPLVADTDTLLLELELLKPVAADRPDLVFGQLQGLEVPIQHIGERVQYVMHAMYMVDAFIELGITGAERAPEMILPAQEALLLIFNELANTAVDYESDPEAAQKRYQKIIEDPLYIETMKTVEDWEEILAGEDAFMHFLLDVAIIVAAAYTGGLAGGFVEGLFGEAVTLGGRVAIGSAAFGAEVTTFTLTSRVLRRGIYGEDLTKGLGGELLTNAAMFLVLKGAGAVYSRFGAPRLPKAWRPAGGVTATFLAFQAWSVAAYRWEKGEWLGLTNPKFWKLAGQNALFLGALHLGMNITKPLVAPVQSKLIQFKIARHNARAESLDAQMALWEGAAEPDYDGAVAIAKRAGALYRERLDILKDIYANNPKDFTAEELSQAEAVFLAQIQAAENIVFQSRFNVTAHESSTNVFYYEGDMEAFRGHYESQGYEVIEADAETGRLRLRSPEGEVLDMIRTRLEPTGAGRRPAGESKAEADYERIRETDGDIATIAAHTGIPAKVIRLVKNHLFVRVQKIAVGPGKVVEMRFTPDSRIAELWTAATEGRLGEAEQVEFKRLMAHEYVEASLMRRGMPYHSAHPSTYQAETPGDYTYIPTAEQFGAHDLAPLVDPNQPPFKHWRELFRIPVTAEQARRMNVPIEDWMDFTLDQETPAASERPSGSAVEKAELEKSQAWWKEPGVATDVNFARHKQRFTSIAATIRNARDVLIRQGRGNLLPRFDDSVLRMPVDEFIRRQPALNREWQFLQRLARGNPSLREKMREFLEGRLEEGGSREVGNREPDLVEFFLERGEIIVTDVTTGTTRLHVFKTAFYRAVLQAMVGGSGGPTIYGLDINVATSPPTSVLIP